jgi:hypothetical protein
MKQRCQNPKTISYKYYGKKGIAVCEEWNIFENFKNWALSNGYKENLTIDRIDNNGNYCPENCQWATNKEQQNKTSYNKLIEYCGEIHNATQWAELLNIPRTTIYNRLRRGWSIEKIMTKSKKKYNWRNKQCQI